MTAAEFTKAFRKLKARGWVPSARRGPTGIGHTLEQALGLTENNIAAPDLGTLELKAHRVHSTSLITLFTFNRKVWKMAPLVAVKKYGTVDANGRLGLYFTLTPTPNGQGLFLHVDDKALAVRHIAGDVLAEWALDALQEQFRKKIPGLILVSAFSEMRAETEWFRFDRAQMMTGTTADILHSQLVAGNVVLDLRLHDAGTRARNHGTAFRIQEKNLAALFESVQDV